MEKKAKLIECRKKYYKMRKTFFYAYNKVSQKESERIRNYFLLRLCLKNSP